MPDYVAALLVDGRDPCTFHAEFFARYRSDIPETMARYGGSLAWQYWRPVESVLLLLSERGVPAVVPEVGELVIGRTTVRHAFRTVRLWELDPEPVLETRNPGLMAWALLMRTGREQAGQLGRLVGATGNDLWAARFLTLGSLRYDRNELERMLGGPKMGLVEAIMEGSSLVRDERERGRAEGKAEGKAEGQSRGKVDEARLLLKRALTKRFPGLESTAAIESIADVDRLESLLLDHVLGDSDRATVEQAILTAAN